MTKVLASGLSRQQFKQGESRETILNTPSPQQLALPYYRLVPKTPLENLRWKLYVRKRCMSDLDFRELIDVACRDDICFYANTVCWIFEPRPPRSMPLTCWCDQADALVWMDECFRTERDFGAEKTRGIGFSWNGAVLTSHKARYVPECKVAMSTKDEDTLDGPDSNFLLGKVVYIHEHLPAWMRYTKTGKSVLKRTLNNHLLEFLDNGSVVQGFAPTDAKRRSMRFTFSWDDEFAYYPRNAQEALASSGGTTNCRGFVSTWHGADNEFHNVMRREKSSMLRILAYWWNNPERYKGCYTTDNGRVKILDKNYKFPADYPFVLDGLKRSPWVDFELSRAGARSSFQLALEELYGLAAERGRKLFRVDAVSIANETVQVPMRYRLDLSNGAPQLVRSPSGDILVWGDPIGGKGGPNVAGCDLGEGMKASYSTLEVISIQTGEQILEVADNGRGPVEFAQYVVNILRALNGDKGDEHTYLSFEQNGRQAVAFGDELRRMGYSYIQQTQYKARVSSKKESHYLGQRNTDGGLANLLELDRAVLDGDVTIRSDSLAQELDEFGKDDDGSPAYPRGADGHGDRAQGFALAWSLTRGRIEEKSVTDAQSSRYSELHEAVAESNKGWENSWKISPGGIWH